MSLSLEGQVALVTGATGGIGGAIARGLAARGVRLHVAGRNTKKIDMLTRTLGAEGHLTDLTVDEDIASLANDVQRAAGRLDILVHSAGVIAHGKLESEPVSTFDAQYAANVRGPYLLTQAMLPLLKKPRGQIVFVNSSAGLHARPTAGQFSATQHAMKALADALRDEVNGDDVRVLSIFPGRTATSRIETLHAREGRPYRPDVLLQPDDVATIALCALTLPWTAEVTNIHIRPRVKSY